MKNEMMQVVRLNVWFRRYDDFKDILEAKGEAMLKHAADCMIASAAHPCIKTITVEKWSDRNMYTVEVYISSASTSSLERKRTIASCMYLLDYYTFISMPEMSGTGWLLYDRHEDVIEYDTIAVTAYKEVKR